MANRTVQLPWEHPSWIDQAGAWIHRELEHRGIRVTGPLDQPHLLPWSTVLRVPTTEGDLYFKAPAPMLVHEGALTEALSRWRPDCILPLLATDLEQGWMLMPDGGIRLREVIRSDGDVRQWEALLPLYAALQIDMVSRCDQLLALGVPDRRLTMLPAQFQELLTDEQALCIDRPDGLTVDEAQRLRELVPAVTAACRRLAGSGVPESLDHGDFHDGNVFVQDGRYVFFDWSEAGISHPFFSLRTVVVSVEVTLGLEEGAAPLERLRDAYLEPWTHYAPRKDLLATFEVAERLWMIIAALRWHSIVSSLEGTEREKYAYTVPSLLKEFLAAHT